MTTRTKAILWATALTLIIQVGLGIVVYTDSLKNDVLVASVVWVWCSIWWPWYGILRIAKDHYDNKHKQ